MLEPEKTIEYFEKKSGDLLDLLKDLVRYDTPTGDVEASREFTRHYRKLLEECGVTCRGHETACGVHLAGDWPGEGGDPVGKPTVAVVLHSDTVWPRGEAARRPPMVREGKLYGPGVLDMRAGLALAVGFFRFLKDQQVDTTRRFRIFVSCDEELGSLEGREFMEREVPRNAVALIPEPPLPGGGMKTIRKGVGIYKLEVTGRRSHAGIDPDSGVSAIDELARQILELHRLREAARGITVNIGEVHGGIGSNVVAGSAWASIDLRFEHLSDGQRADGNIRSLAPLGPGVSVRVTGGIVFPPMDPDEKTCKAIAEAVGIASSLGMDLETGRSGGGSDGSYLSSVGVRVLDGLGVEGGGAHSLDEHVRVDRIPIRAALLTHLALEISTGASE